jgi:hypothetical protein
MSNILTQFYVGVGITGGSISLACLLVSALVQRGFGDSLSNDVVRRKAMAGLANSMFEQEHMGDIIVQGQVVDQDGADLEGVNLEAELMLGAYAGRSPTNPVVRQTVGPTFSLTYTNAFSMKLTFRKKAISKRVSSSRPTMKESPHGAVRRLLTSRR